MQNISNQPPQHSQKVEAANGENEKRFGQNQQKQQQKVYQDLLIYQYLGHDAINQDKPIQIQYLQIENNQSQENQALKSFNNNLKAMQEQSNLKNDNNINQQNYVQQNQAKMSIYLQTPNNDSYLQQISTVQLINSTEIKQLKHLNHYCDDKNHQLLPLWVKENMEQKLYLYSQSQLSEIKQVNQNELELSFQNNQGIRQLKFALPIDSDVFFIDSNIFEDKLNENDKAYDKQINSECLTEFALQLLLKETFVKFLQFCNQFDTKFNRVKFLNYLILFGFRDSYNHQQFDLKTFLIFLFAQSINREQYIINPRIKIYDIFSNLQDDDRIRINQASYQLNKCKDWSAIKQLIEEVFLKEATFKQSKDYYKLKNTFQLNKSVKDVFEAKIKSEFESDLTEIFNQQYMYDSGMNSEDYYDLFIKQTFQIQNENTLKYLEKNISLINFLVEKTQIFNTKANQNVKETVYSIVKKISKEDFEIFDQILNSQNNDIDVLFQILQRIKVLGLDEKSIMNRILDKITKKIIDQMKQIKLQQEFKQKMENLKQTLYKIFICNWNNLNNSQKINQAIKFEVYRYLFFRQYQQELVEEEKNLFTHFLKVNDIIQNILEISSQIQNETELSQEKKNDLIEKTYQGILIKLNKIEDLQEFSKVLKYLCEDKINQKIFEKNREQIINSLLERINKLIQLDKILPTEVWNISYILQEQIFELLFNVLTSIKENMKFATNKIYKCVQTIFFNSISLKNTTWNDYKVINEKKERFNNFMKFLSLNSLGRFKEFETLYNDYKQLKCFINLMKKLHVSDIDDKKELLDMIDKDENLEVKTIQDKFQRIIDKNRDFIGASQYLVDLKLFDEISNKYPLKNKTFEETMHEIYGFALPFIESIYQYLLEQEFPERQQDFKNDQVEQFKQSQPQIQFKNCYKFLKYYFKNQFSLNTESLKQECENLCMICEQSFKSNISPKFFVDFIQQGYHRILDYELLMEIQKTASNFKIDFPMKYQNLFDNLNKLVSQDDLSKQEFFEGSQTIQEEFNTYLNETVQKCNNNQVDRIFLKQQVVPFISQLLNVMDLYSNFKNEVDLQELLFDDDNDLANRIQYYIQIKKYLDEFNKTLNNNILLYIQQVIQFFYQDEKSKEIRQKIEDISKFKDYIQQKLIELGTSQVKNSVKILQLFIKYAKIDINVKDTYLEKNQFEKEKKQDNLQNNSLKQQEDERNYKVTYRTQKRVNNQEKNEDYNEEQIFQIIQRLNIISGWILDEAYKSEVEKEQFKENRKKFEEIYNLIQINLIQALEKFIQYGYLGGFIKEVEIIIDDKENTIDTVIKNIKSIVDEKENQIKQWTDVDKEVQQRYQFMKLIIPKCYPDLFRYFQYLLNVKVNQDIKITTKNSVTTKEQQFQQSDPIIQFNMEEMISFYYMNTSSLANQLRVNKNLIKLDTINEKICLIGDYLNQQFERGQNTLKFSSNKTGFLQRQCQKLVAKNIQCESYGDMCKQLLNYFGKQDKPDKLQFLFANQQTTEMDIEVFLNRVIYFEMGNDKLRKFFIIDFKKLKYQVQKFAIQQIDRYMNIDANSQFKTKNELIILYLINQDMDSSQDQDDENTEEDCIMIPLTEEFKKKDPQYENRNIHLFYSDIAGVGKTFQIQKKIRQSKQPQQLLINIPAHQFQNIENLLKILRSKKKEMHKQNQDQIHEMELDPNYTYYQISQYMQNASPEQKENIRQMRYNIIYIFLEQSLKNTFLNTSIQSQTSKNYYENYMQKVEEEQENKSNKMLKSKKQSQSKISEWNQKKHQIEQQQDTSNRQAQQEKKQQPISICQYLTRLLNCFKSHSQFQINQNLQPTQPRQEENEELRIQEMNKIPQYDQAIKNLIFFINGGIIAAIFKDDRDDQRILKLEQLMSTLKQYITNISTFNANFDQEFQLRIPHIGSTEDEYILIRTLLYICSKNPSKFIDEQAQKQKPDLSKILQEKAFTKDNTCKLIQIAFKIYSGVPLVIMGETGIGKTVNIQILSEIMRFKFEVLRLSAGTTIDQIIKFMKDIKNKYDANSKIVIFFDEINTNQNIYGLLKEIFIEKTMNGKRINKNNQNIVCIAACNPYEYIQKKEKNDFEAGLLTRFQLEKPQKANLTYHVYPLPESMLPFVVNYGQLEEKVEEKNIYQMINKINFRSKLRKQNQFEMDKKKEFDHTINIFSEEELKCIQQLIMTSQQFVHCKQKSSRSASLRDVSRTIKFIEFFMKDYFLKRGDKDTETQKQKSVILSLYLCYQIRLNSQKQREEYQEVIKHIQSKYAFFSNVNQSSFFDKTINEELDYFINQLKINFQKQIPLFITGEPGTSKTLSFALVINCFKGISSSSQFLQGFPSIKEFYIQGNLQTQSEEIRKAFQQAKDAQEKGILPVVFFDEAGQAELSENNPNKVLHELLDEGDVSFIASSNYSLDYVKQNRCLHLQINNNSLEDLKDFVNQLVNQNTQLKIVLNDFCHVYYEFHDSLKNNIHNSRDFYYTIKYCCSIVTKNPSKYLNQKYIVLLLYKATIKNFSGYNKNTSLIRDEFLKQFSKYKEQISEFEINTQEIIEECFKPICEDFVYHSRFPMLITDNTDQAIEFAKMQLEKNGLQSQVKTGSHFKKDFYEDKTREISSINESIEQNYSIISVNQDYIYAVYYDFFTMNFSRIRDKQKFRLNYKQIQTRIEVPQNYLFIMIVTKDQYMKMDLALLNRFEKHIFSQKLVFQRQEVIALKSILKEFKMIKSLFQKDKHFLSFVKKSYISGMVQVEFKKLDQSDEDLKNKCIDLIGNLSKKYDIVRLRKQNPNGHFQAWNQKTYLDNLIEFVKQQKIKSLSSQNLAFYSIVYTLSNLCSNYEALLKENGFETLLIDLSQIKQKFELEQYAEDYYKKNYNLMIVRTSCQDENPQNIYFIRSYLDDCRLKYQQKFQKSIIILIQNSDSSHNRLPFCMKWDQFQIDNLLPYAYTQSSLKEQEIQEINKILNYRYIHGRNERDILENKKIFNYFTQMQGFCSKLIQRMTFRFKLDKEQFYQYYEKIRKILEDHFKNQESIAKNHFYEYFVEHLKQNSNQDDLWSYRYDLIKGQNYEKQMINFLKNKVESVILTILSQYEDLNLLINIDKIKNLGLNHQNLYMAVFQKYVKQAIAISDGSEIKRIPQMNIQYIFSNIIYNKIENTKDKYEQYDAQQYKNYISSKLKIFQDIFKADNFNNYIEDFLFYKDIKRYMYQDEENKNYALFCEKLLVELNKKNCFHDCSYIHEILWNNEKIFTEILELISIFKDLKNAYDLAIFLVNQGVFTNKKDILENASEFYYQALLNMKQVIQIQYIDHFIKIFPSQNSSLRFQIISQCYQSYLKYDNFINIKELLIIFKDIKSELIATQLQRQYFTKPRYNSLCITTFGILNNNKVDIDPCFEHIMIEIIYFFNQNQPNDYLQADINLIMSYFFKNIQEQINQNFLKLFNAILNNNTNKIIFKKQYLENLDKILKTYEVKTEDKFTYLLIRIGEIIFQKEELIYSLNPNLVISNFKEYEKTGQATVQFIFTYIYFRLIAPEIANMIKEGYEKDLISNENFDFFKKMNNCKQQKTTEFLFIDMFKKIYEQNDFDPYEFPWCDENYINKIEKLDQYKYNFLVLATLKLMKKNVEDSYFTKWQKDVLDKTQNLKDQSSLAKFIIYLASQMLEKNNQSNQLNQFIQPQPSLYITSIYVPFNSITKQQLQAHEIQAVLASVSDKKKVYQCACGFVYAVDLLKQTDEYLLIVSLQLFNKLIQLDSKNFTDINNRDQFEQNFSNFCKQFPTKIEEIKKNFDNKNSTQRDQKQQYLQLQKLLREQDKNTLFLNTLQYYQLPLQSELEGQYLHKGYKYKLIIQTRESISKIKLVYPLIFFYKKIHQMYSNRLTKKFSEQQTLSKILKNKPYLLKYYEENVIKSWNKLCDFFPEIVIGCKPQPTQQLGSAQNTPLENFLITKKKNQTQAIPSDQLFFFITEVTQIQNTVLKEISNEVRQQKNIFDLYDDDLIAISDNLNLENLIYFDHLQLVVNQQKKNFNTEQLKNYYFFDQLFTKNQILDFQENNYFILKKDTTNLGNIYSNKILQDDTQQIQRLKQNMKERFLKLCHQQEQQFEVREQLFFLHDFMKNLPQDKIQECLENSLYSELEKYGFIIDESYFKECLRQFQVYHIFDLLVILETELMDELVQNLEQTFKVVLPDEQFVKFIKEFKLKVLDKLNKKLSANQHLYENEVKNKSNKDLQLVLGRYIIRNLQSQKFLPNFIESNIFESINYFYDQQFLDPLLEYGEDEVKFEDLNIRHKYIYNLYERLALDYNQQLDLQQKIIQQQKYEVSKNINNLKMQIFGFEMDKRQLNGHLHNLNAQIPQNNKQLVDDDENDDLV
ncbi:hypothetical protein ABPG72_005115 [Tetrahymena utriculariae]